MSRPSQIVHALKDAPWGEAAAWARRAADRIAAAGWLRLPRGEPERPGPELRLLVRDALEAALFPPGRPVRVAGPGGEASGGVLPVARRLEELTPAAVPGALASLVRDGAVVAVVPVWPAGRRSASKRARTLRRADWWREAARRSGAESLVELRREAGGHACLVLGAPAPPHRAPAPVRAPAHPPRDRLHIRLHDDLSRATSFAWISASIALALERRGVSVSIAPTEVTASIAPARRRALEALIERGSAPRPTAEIGWTHFWPEYQRRLGGDHPLALFAVNYAFSGAAADGWDPWMRELVHGTTPLGPISAFCADVLAQAGVPAERLDVVPLAATEGVETAAPGVLARSRALKLLHVTNATDPLRHGTDVALAAFERAFTPADDVTLVVRDYSHEERDVTRTVERLAGAGFDVRYWPAFYPDRRLGTLLGAFDALLAPFRGEGFGIKLLDAMACGLPVVAPRFGGPADFLDEDASYTVPFRLAPVRAGYDAGRLELGNGALWAEVDPAGLASRLRELHADPAELARRGERARHVASERFSWDRSAEAILASVERRRRGT